MSKKKKSSSSQEVSPRAFARRREQSLGHKVGDTSQLYPRATEEERKIAGSHLSSATLIPSDEPSETELIAPEQMEPEASPRGQVPSASLPNDQMDQSTHPSYAPSGEQEIPPELLQRNQSFTNKALQYGLRSLSPLTAFDPQADFNSQGNTGIQALAAHAQNQIPLGWGNQLSALVDTGADALSGDVIHNEGNGVFGDLLDQYRANRGIRQENLRRMSEAHPISSASGSILGSVPSIPLFGGAGPYSRIGNAAGLGGFVGLGSGEADLTKGEFGKAFGEAATGAASYGLLGGISEGLRAVAPLFRPKTLDAIAAHNRISGGGDPRSASMLDIYREGELPAAVKGLQQAEKKGLLRTEGGFITNKKYGMPSASNLFNRPLESFGKSKTGEAIRREFNRDSEIDYDLLREGLGKELSKGRAEKLGMLEPIANKSWSLQDFLGPNPSAVQLRTFQALKNLEQQTSKYGVQLSQDEATSLQALKQGLSSKTLTFKEAEELSSNLGILTRKSLGKQLPEGSPQKLLVDTKARIDQQIINELNTVKKGLGETYHNKNVELHNESEFLDSVKEGHSKFLRKWGQDAQFEGGILTRAAAAAGGSPRGFNFADILGGSLATGEKLLGRGLQFASAATKPAIWAWLPQVLPSYKNGTISDQKDIDLYSHYVDISKLSPKEKARLKSHVNTSGTIDHSVVPESVRNSSMNKLQKENESLDNQGSGMSKGGFLPDFLNPFGDVPEPRYSDFSPSLGSMAGWGQEGAGGRPAGLSPYEQSINTSLPQRNYSTYED